jgi:hypothetical protein
MGYRSIRGREIGKRAQRVQYKPYVQWALDAHARLLSTLYYNVFGVEVTTNANGVRWVHKELVRLQNIAYKRELK